MKWIQRFVLLLAWCFISTASQAAEPTLKVPDGFSVRRAAPPGRVVFPMFGAFDDRGRLFVAESSGLDLYAELQKLSRKCRVSILEDRDGDGEFESSKVFADNLVFPMGLVWRDGKLYVADPPELVALEDTDGDGRADKRTVILSGFGHSDNGSLHGLTFGPDGWLYMTMGNPDGYQLKRSDGSVLSGTSGALLRCRPDGSGIEVLSRGFENLVEIAFLPSGEIIGTDNWFSLPSDGVRDALVHLLEGGLYPLHLEDSGTPQLVSGEPLPAINMYPAVAQSGLMRYQGNVFPERMRGALFSAEHNTRKVVMHRLERAGSTFHSSDEDFVTAEDPDFHPSDVLEDADGSLLVIDTGSWYIHHCPTGRIRNAPAQGGLFRVRFDGADRRQDPWERSLAWEKLSCEELIQWLESDSSAARERASLLLSRLGASAIEPLAVALRHSKDFAVQEQAIWALARIKTDDAEKVLRDLLASEDAALAGLSARALARCDDLQAESALIELLRHKQSYVRLAAAEALAHCGSSRTVPAVLVALSGETDRILEHALINVLYHFASASELETALSDQSLKVQKAAMLLLDQAPHRKLPVESALKRLFAEDDSLRRAARSALRKHPEWVSSAVPVLRDLALKPNLSPIEQETLREFILSFRRQPSVSALVAETLSEGSEATRVLLLEVLSRTEKDQFPESWLPALKGCLESSSREIRFGAIQAINTLQISGLEENLAGIAHNSTNASGLRVAALRPVIRRRATLDSEEFDFLLGQMERSQSSVARLAASEIMGAAALNDGQFARFLGKVATDPMISPALILSIAHRAPLKSQSATNLLNYLDEALRNGAQFSVEQVTWLKDLVANDKYSALIAGIERGAAEQRQQLAAMQPLLQGGDPNRGHHVFLERVVCSTCHRVGKQGGTVGPDLTKIGAIRSGRDILESIIAPSATFAQGYDTYTITTKNGDEFTGIRVRQLDESIVLRATSGTDVRFDKNQIISMERQKLSMMPEGLLSALTQEEIRDLLAYLQSLK